jgi:hypothetical protein
VQVADADHTFAYLAYGINFVAHWLVAADFAALKVVFCRSFDDPADKPLSYPSVVFGGILCYIHILNLKIYAPFDLQVGGAFSCRRKTGFG